MPRPVHRDRAIVERHIADHVHVSQPRVVGRRKHVDPEPEIVEKDVVLDPFHRVVAGRVDPVVQVLVGAVVVHDAAGDFGIPVRRAMVDSLPPGVVDNHVDQAGPGCVDLDVAGQGCIAERIRLHDFQAPEPDIRPLDPQVAVDRRPLTRILAHDDRGGRGAGEGAREHAAVRPSAQPDRVSRPHLAARARETRDQVPRPRRCPVAAARAAGRHVMADRWDERWRALAGAAPGAGEHARPQQAAQRLGNRDLHSTVFSSSTSNGAKSVPVGQRRGPEDSTARPRERRGRAAPLLLRGGVSARRRRCRAPLPAASPGRRRRTEGNTPAAPG